MQVFILSILWPIAFADAFLISPALVRKDVRFSKPLWSHLPLQGAVHALTKHRGGGWLPSDSRHVARFISKLKAEAALKPQPLVEPVQNLKEIITDDPVLLALTNNMFQEAIAHHEFHTPVGSASVEDLDEFLMLLNHIVTTTAPEFTVCLDPNTNNYDPCGLVGFPINALLDFPMATASGYIVFSNQLIDQQLKKVLTHWTDFLNSSNSTYTFTKTDNTSTPRVVGWLSDYSKDYLVQVAVQATGSKIDPTLGFKDIFECDPSSPTYGYKSWDEFFTREFKHGKRPIASPSDNRVIVSACESAPLQIVTNVRYNDKFWLKGQSYSLQDMMNYHPLAKEFADGTVYQAFLSALSYHRWNSPVDGTVRDAFIVEGTYYLENLYNGFKNDNPDPDESAPNDSQPFLSAVATRAVIFIEADNSDIGLMCFIAIGMAEVSSCEITVQPNQKLKKGDQLGMFHFGGSTHCLCFRPETKLDFCMPAVVGLNATNIAVGSKLAVVVDAAEL